jgi:hypothetical protein
LAGGEYSYRYEVFNQPTADRSITMWSIVAPDGVERPPMRFGTWRGPGLSSGLPIAKQTLLPRVEPGRAMTWVYDPERGRPIEPGGSATDFVVTSSYRPGYTTAYLKTWDAVKWPPSDPDVEWPDILVTQCLPVLSREWVDKQVLTVGPMFSPDEKPNKIAQHFLLAIRQLDRMGELDANSPFLKELQEVLEPVLTGGQTAVRSIESTPSSDRERELDQAVRLTLAIPQPH